MRAVDIAVKPYSEYTNKQLTGKLGYKDLPRQQCLEFILSCLPPEQKTRMLCIPGLQWIAENSMAVRNKNIKFIGIEKLRKEYLSSANLYMPGVGGERATHWTWKVRQNNCRTKRVWFSQTSNAVLLNTKMEYLLGLNPDGFADNAELLRNSFLNFNCVWLDPCTPLLRGYIQSLRNLHRHLDPKFEEIPTVIGFMAARDQGHSSLEQRFDTVEAALNDNPSWEFDLRGGISYKGEGRRTPMGVVLGFMRRK